MRGLLRTLLGCPALFGDIGSYAGDRIGAQPIIARSMGPYVVCNRYVQIPKFVTMVWMIALRWLQGPYQHVAGGVGNSLVFSTPLNKNTLFSENRFETALRLIG